ncbi:hypothetical protein EON65_11175 [archaeon]|nr:MAG: hypothetical protein EON65_11175 [archaeon]
MSMWVVQSVLTPTTLSPPPSFRLIGLNLETFGIYILISMYVSFTITMLGLCISAFAPNADAANAIAPPFLIIGRLFDIYYTPLCYAMLS